jgi:hypothetical protein
VNHLFFFDLDGDKFEVESDDDQPGVVHCSWINGVIPGYGFIEGNSVGRLPSRAEAEVSIRRVLHAIDPKTGYF